MIVLSSSIIERFWEGFIPEPNSGCWLWEKAIGTKGYGRLWSDVEDRLLQAHEVSYTIHFSVVNFGLQVLHKCDNKPCVSPYHIYAGTHGQNVKDAISRRRYKYGENNGRATITNAIALDIITRLNKGGSPLAIAKKLSIPRYIVNDIKHGKSFKYL